MYKPDPGQRARLPTDEVLVHGVLPYCADRRGSKDRRKGPQTASGALNWHGFERRHSQRRATLTAALLWQRGQRPR